MNKLIKHKPDSRKVMLENLSNYFGAQDHYCNYGTNFTSIVSIKTFSENGKEPAFISKVHSQAANTDSFILKMNDTVENIGKVNKARRTYYNLSQTDKEILHLGFYQSPGKFKSRTRGLTKTQYLKTDIDLSALCFYLATKKNTIAAFETLSDKEIKSLAKTAEVLFINTMSVYFEQYDKDRNTV